MRTWPVSQLPQAPRPNVRLADRPPIPAASDPILIGPFGLTAGRLWVLVLIGAWLLMGVLAVGLAWWQWG